MPTRKAHVFVLLVFFFLVAVLIMFNDFLAVALMSGFLGFARSFIQVPLPLVFAEYNLQRFPSAFGLYSVIFGIIAVMIGPFIGKQCVTFEAS